MISRGHGAVPGNRQVEQNEHGAFFIGGQGREHAAGTVIDLAAAGFGDEDEGGFMKPGRARELGIEVGDGSWR